MSCNEADTRAKLNDPPCTGGSGSSWSVRRSVAEAPILRPMDSSVLEQARKLSIDEQLALLEALWDDLAGRGQVPQPTAAQLAELDRRRAEDEANPDDVVPWSVVEAEAIARIRR